MDKSINKFLAFLDYVEKELTKKVQVMLAQGLKLNSQEFLSIERRSKEVINLRKFLTVKKNYCDNHGEIFADFHILSEFLDASDLSYRDKYNLVLFFIKKNVKSGILAEPAMLVNLRNIESSGVDKNICDFIVDLVANDEITSFLSLPESYYSGFELEVYQCIKSFSIDLTPHKKTTLAIKEHYLDKNEGINEDDVSVLTTTLSEMGVSDSCKEAFMYVVKKKIVKPEVIQEVAPVQNEKKKDPNVITEKEFKMMKKHIKSTFNVYTRELLRPISYDEMLYTAYLMIRLGYPEYDIINLFRASMSVQKYLNIWTVADFLQEIDKFKFYMYEEDFNSVLEYLNEADEDPLSSSFWVNEASKLIREAAQKFSSKYDYELSLAKSYKSN